VKKFHDAIESAEVGETINFDKSAEKPTRWRMRERDGKVKKRTASPVDRTSVLSAIGGIYSLADGLCLPQAVVQRLVRDANTQKQMANIVAEKRTSDDHA